MPKSRVTTSHGNTLASFPAANICYIRELLPLSMKNHNVEKPARSTFFQRALSILTA